MHHYRFKNKELWCEDVRVTDVAEEIETPFYLYSQRTILENYARIDKALDGLDHLVCFAVKANSNPEILSQLAAHGCGADVVSRGELYLALASGIPPDKIVFAGVGKRDDEIEYALENEILALNVESVDELRVIDDIARSKGRVASVALRVNPNIEIEGHPYISTATAIDKFGLDWDTVKKTFENVRDLPNLRLVGLHAHLGSQVISLEPYADLVRFMCAAIADLRTQGDEISYLNIGGGLGVRYRNVLDPPSLQSEGISPDEVLGEIRDDLARLECKIIMEPGRALVAQAGVLVTRVLYRKVSHGKPFLIVDAGMNDLIRPSLYDAYHEILPIKETAAELEQVDVVGPICESGDFFAKARMLPKLQRGDRLAVMTTGAYGFTLSSNYNARPRPAEVLVDASQYRIIREPGKIENLWV